MLHCFLLLIFPKTIFSDTYECFSHTPSLFHFVKVLVFSLKLLNRYILIVFCLFKGIYQKSNNVHMSIELRHVLYYILCLLLYFVCRSKSPTGLCCMFNVFEVKKKLLCLSMSVSSCVYKLTFGLAIINKTCCHPLLIGSTVLEFCTETIITYLYERAK